MQLADLNTSSGLYSRLVKLVDSIDQAKFKNVEFASFQSQVLFSNIGTVFFILLGGAGPALIAFMIERASVGLY